jgi:hypothetical protein
LATLLPLPPSPLDVSTSPSGIMWWPCIHESQARRGKSQYCYIRGSYWRRGGIMWVAGLIYWGMSSVWQRDKENTTIWRGVSTLESLNGYIEFAFKKMIIEFICTNTNYH